MMNMQDYNLFINEEAEAIYTHILIIVTPGSRSTYEQLGLHTQHGNGIQFAHCGAV